MTLQEAIKYSLNVLWKVERCTDIDPWCVGVIPVDKIFFQYPNSTINSELEIIPFGSVDRIVADYIVDSHNYSIELYRRQKEGLEALQKLSDLDQELGLQ
jgi:hypothetical protein